MHELEKRKKKTKRKKRKTKRKTKKRCLQETYAARRNLIQLIQSHS